jgi:hypothetical protein
MSVAKKETPGRARNRVAPGEDVIIANIHSGRVLKNSVRSEEEGLFPGDLAGETFYV